MTETGPDGSVSKAGPEEVQSVAISGLAHLGGAALTRAIPGQNYSIADKLALDSRPPQPQARL